MLTIIMKPESLDCNCLNDHGKNGLDVVPRNIVSEPQG